MSFFKKWFGKRPSPPEDSSVATVPPGHTLSFSRPEVFPRVQCCHGGLLIAHMGIGGVNQSEDVEVLFAEVVASLKQSAGTALLSQANVKLSGLFAPHNPEVSKIRGGVIWTTCAGSLRGLTEDGARVQRLVQLFSQVSAAGGGPQWLVVRDLDWPNAAPTIAFLGGVGVSVRTPADDGTVLAEVGRPEGVVLSAIAGASVALGEGGLEDIVPVSPATTSEPPLRDGRLARALLAVHREPADPGLWITLCALLLARPSRMLLFVGEQRQLFMMEFPGGISGIPVFGDLISQQQAAKDIGLSEGMKMAGISIQQLAELALTQRTTVLFNVFQDAQTPLYVRPMPAVLAALMSGQVPTIEVLSAPSTPH